ncbi:polysaccharide pyruvyl transferase family protein [Flagellimonas sp. DF-77]|uniref:polysaccharide pyruvyl transferase family protein n=1 Tax=Flagellimonas algarum TaxID=3230298 RepID=UPI00339472A0
MDKQRKWTTIREYFGLKYLEAAISYFLVFFIFLPLLKRKKTNKGDQIETRKEGKTKILLYGAYGNQSVGDDAILQSILENLDEQKFDITISSYRPYLTQQVTSHKVIWQGRTLDGLFYMYRTLKTTDILVFGGGGVLETHNNSMTTTVGMMYKLSKVFLAKLMNVKVYCFAIGSNTKPYSKPVYRLVATLLDIIDGISTRDRKSYAFLKAINPELKISSLADPAMLLGMELQNNSSPKKVQIGINVMPYYKLLQGDKSKLKAIRTEIAKSLDLLIEKWDCKITFIPMVLGDDTSEQEAIYELIDRKASVVIMPPDYTPDELMRILSGFTVFIGTRLHPNILAYNVNTPIVGIAYHDKIFSLFDHIQRPDDVQSIQSVSSAKLVASVDAIIADFEKVKSDMLSRQAELIDLAKRSFTELETM